MQADPKDLSTLMTKQNPQDKLNVIYKIFQFPIILNSIFNPIFDLLQLQLLHSIRLESPLISSSPHMVTCFSSVDFQHLCILTLALVLPMIHLSSNFQSWGVCPICIQAISYFQNWFVSLQQKKRWSQVSTSPQNIHFPLLRTPYLLSLSFVCSRLWQVIHTKNIARGLALLPLIRFLQATLGLSPCISWYITLVL